MSALFIDDKKCTLSTESAPRGILKSLTYKDLMACDYVESESVDITDSLVSTLKGLIRKS